VSKILYIINPASQGGSGTGAWEEFKASWPDGADAGRTIVTERPGHAREIAATAEGHSIFAVVGGDGTVGEVMSEIMDRQEPRPSLAIIPAGTGNDIARNIGINSVADAVGALRGERSRAFDLVRVDRQVDGRSAHRHAFLFGIVGFSSVPMLKPWMKRLLGPAVAYYLATFLQFIVYRVPHMTIRVGEREISGRKWMVIVGNAELSAGGSMCLAPGACTDDGILNITIITSQPKLKMLTRLLPKIATGAHVHESDVDYFPGTRIEVDSTPPAIVDLDGDIYGTTPVTFTVCPRALQIISPDGVAYDRG